MGYPLQLESGKIVELTDVRPDKSNFVTSSGVGITTVQEQRFAIGYVLYFAEMEPRFFPVDTDRIRGKERDMYALTVNVLPWMNRLEPQVYTTPRPDSHGLAELVRQGYVLQRVADLESEARLTVEKVQSHQRRERVYGYLKGIMELLDLLGQRDISMAYIYRVDESQLVGLAQIITKLNRDLGGAYFDGQSEGSWDTLDYFSKLAASRPDGSIVVEPEMLINALLAMIPQIRMVYDGTKPEGEKQNDG